MGSTRNRQIRKQQFYSSEMLTRLANRSPGDEAIVWIEISSAEQLSRSRDDRGESRLINTSLQRRAMSAGICKPLQRFLYHIAKPLKRLKGVWFVPSTARKWGVNRIILAVVVVLLSATSSFATTKGLSQIVTPDLEPEGDFSLSFQIQDKRIANPYQLQAELGLTDWGEVAVFRGFDPDEWIFGTEIGVLRKEPYLLSLGFINWSPHLNEDPQPFIEAGYWGEHNKVCAGFIHAGYKNEAILGYAYDFNERWRVQVDWQSGSENASTIGFTCNVTPDFQFNPALYINNGPNHDLMGYIVFTYTFHVWGKKDVAPVAGHKSAAK